MRNLSTRVNRLEGERTGPSDAQIKEEGDQYIKKLEALALRFTEADRGISMEDYKANLSTV